MKRALICLALMLAAPVAAQTPHQVALGLIADEIGFGLDVRTTREMRQNLRRAGYVQTDKRYDPTVAPFYEIWETKRNTPYDKVRFIACQNDKTFIDQFGATGIVTPDAATYGGVHAALEAQGLLRDAETNSRKPVNQTLVRVAERPADDPQDDDHGALRWVNFYISQLQYDAESPIYHFTEVASAYQCPRLY